MQPDQEKAKYALRHLLDETSWFGKRANRCHSFHLALGILPVGAAGAGFLAPALGIQSDSWTRALSLLAAALAFIQNIMKRAITKYNLDQTDNVGLFQSV